jgi:hypothetical protein
MYIVRNFYQDRPGYKCLQQAVPAHYWKHYKATPEPRPDLFVCLTGAEGAAPGFACVGITYGDSGKLFSEFYLEEPLEHTYAVDRARIVEVSAFSSFQSGNGAGKHLLSTVIKTLALHNYGLVVLTATEQVRQILCQIVTSLDDLGSAEINCVKDPQVNWGTYYCHAPRVVASRLTPPTSWVRKPSSLVTPRTVALPVFA